jgi:hypothetical protein
MIDPTLVVGILAAVVAILGYTITNSMNRIERRSRIYANAISALVQFQNLPFRIRRRSDSSDATRTIVGERVRDVQETLSYHVVLLRLDSPRVGTVFAELVRNTRKEGVRYRHDAWASPPATSDADMSLVVSYEYHNEAELEKCIVLMQRELSTIRALSPRLWFRARP